jgi:hypothetical protein
MSIDKPANDDEASARDPAVPAPSGVEQLARRVISRRALARAGWTVPIVMALSTIPLKAFASCGTLIHSDTPHSDTTVGLTNTHVDAAHLDVCT